MRDNFNDDVPEEVELNFEAFMKIFRDWLQAHNINPTVKLREHF